MKLTKGTRLRSLVAIATALTFLIGIPVASAAGKHLDPSSVRSVRASAVKSKIVVHWEAPSSTGGAVILRYNVTSHPSGRSCSTRRASCTFSNLKVSTPYTFTVVATNRYGKSPESAPSNSVAAAPPRGTTTPAPPSTPPITTTTIPTGGGSGGGGGGGGGGTTPPTSYSVTFNANGGTGSMAEQTSSSAESLSANTFAYTGFTFAGWNTFANGSGTTYANQATYSFASSLTLYAQWTATYTVYFIPNGGSGNMAAVTSATPAALPANTYYRNGYAFAGWNTITNGTGTAYANQAVYPFNATVNLFAQWTPVTTYTVTFNANGGTGSMAAQVSSLSESLTPNSFSNQGYVFAGWNTNANGSGTSYADQATYSFTTSTTLHAQWTVAPSMVTFNPNGAEGSMFPEQSYVPETLTSNAFVYPGFTFAGWNTSANGSGTAYANRATYSFTSSVTLYAQWTALPSYTVTFNSNGGTGSLSPETSSIEATLTTNSFTRSGYVFQDWNTQSNGSGTSYLDGAYYPFTASVTLYAQWTNVVSPTIFLEPTNVVHTGGNVTFTAAASGSPTPTVQWYVSSDGGSTWTAAAGATSPSYSPGIGENNGFDYRAIFTNAHGTATTVTVQVVFLLLSTNWSGFVESDVDYTHVSAQWTVPAVTCNSSSDLQAAQWVGIDGTTIPSTYLMQDGTSTNCVGTTPQYGAWYEFLGDDAVDNGYEVPLDPSQYPVSPGDLITASVNFSGGVWTFTVANSTQNWTFSANVTNPSPAPERGTAEWIAEDPEVCASSCVQGGLANFGSVTFTNVSATSSFDGTHTIIYDSSYGYQMVDSAPSPVVMASPGVLSDDGTSFTVTWQSSS